MILLLYAHPYPERSRACAALLSALEGLPGLEQRSLYDLYPDFDVDVEAEQGILARAEALVWMHPLYWYSTPALLQHWFEKVLLNGFAYGPTGSRLAGKPVLWVTTTGGDEHAFSAEGRHRHAFATFVAPVEQTARYCGLDWQPPFVVHGAHQAADEKLVQAGADLRERIAQLAPRKAAAA